MEKQIEKILDHLRTSLIVPANCSEVTTLTGGTESSVYAIGSSAQPYAYVLKRNANHHSETEFLRQYEDITLFPNVVYETDDYYVYEFLSGTTGASPSGYKATWLRKLVLQVINAYAQQVETSSVHWREAPATAAQWQQEARTVIASRFTDAEHAIARDLLYTRSKSIEHAHTYLLHGDLGVHNMVFEDTEMVGVIDPIPCVGRPLYDVLYAFFSSPDDLTLDVLQQAVTVMKHPYRGTQQHFAGEAVLALYQRMATCLIHHPDDFPAYQLAWTYWTELLD
ncbi:phosphotransferase family protein [Aureibacillus halotolerans]|uniref:Phosphotransferase family enzyme n=1 Tax=Aureibacillus halotolerans TaxID=1508390 RepID=A0A4V3D5R4_9BACI|nr:phosphotransferase [Aureibacillus halotolerans]TDQ41057.1 phosphotransferase family enzyme [Aureibacillus halotolerans]